jgi:NAD(P)H-dependent FMN reductase
MAEYLIIGTSLRPASLSQLMAAELEKIWKEMGLSAERVDLRQLPLPLCDAEAAYGHPNVAPLTAKIEASRVIVLAVPIYNYDTNAAAKNVIELTGSAWEDKIVGFLCAAGGDASYMSVMALANSLMLDFRCIVLPRFVYATGDNFAGGKISNTDITRRIRELAESAVKLRVA